MRMFGPVPAPSPAAGLHPAAAAPAETSGIRERSRRRWLQRAGVLLAAPLLAFAAAGCEPDAPASATAQTATAEPAPVETPAEAAADAPAAPAPAPAQTGETAAPAAAPAPGAAAVDVLATLPVKGRAPKTGYDREQFGQAWADIDRNGCDTRNDILKGQLTSVAFANAGGCKVASGILADPYTGAVISFLRGQETSAAVQIDHVVALSDAWQKGAQQLSPAQRAAFANDPLNLLAVDGPTNQAKGDGDAATWLPPNHGYRCEYVARQVAVKATYALWVTQAEHDAIAAILATCPGQPVPGDVTPAPAPAPDAQPVPGPAVGPGSGTYYANCEAVRAAGAAPIRPGEPGYRNGLDRDGDGVACE